MISLNDYKELSNQIEQLKDDFEYAVKNIENTLESIETSDTYEHSGWYVNNWNTFVHSVLKHLPLKASVADSIELEELLNNFIKGR